MKKTKIYTKTGDTGETGLVSGSRLPKSDLRIDLYGELDELNSRLGFACSEMAEKIELQQTIEFIHHVQSAIFDLGSNLACEEEHRKNYQLAQIQDQLISDIELEIDKLDAELEPLKNFILPGGSKISSLVHLCRTHTRTVERKAILYRNTTGEELPENCLKFLNRLSDYFFILARNCNRITKTDEILWKPRN